MEEKSTYKMGSVGDGSGYLNILLGVDENGLGIVSLFASKPNDRRVSGVLINLGSDGYEDLKELLYEAGKTIERLKNAAAESRYPTEGNREFERKLGSVSSGCGTLSFSIVGSNPEHSHLQLHAHDPNNFRKASVLILLSGREYRRPNEIIDEMDKTIDELIETGEMKKLRSKGIFDC
jgi:hypothetical protein